MKFGKHLQKRQLDIPEYAASFVNYKALKKLIKQLSTTPTILAQNAPLDPRASLQANKAQFFFRLERELEKVNAFYLQKEAELKLRLKTLLDKKRVMQSRSLPTSKVSASFITLQEGFEQFSNDLNKLEQFADVNATAFSKILKKWDKTSKSRTKELYLSRAVEVQPCFNHDIISDLSDQATTSLLELGAWAEGEKIQFDPSRANGHVISSQVVGTEESDADSQLLQATIAGNMIVLGELVTRLRGAPDAKARFSRSFLAAISEAPLEALQLLLDTELVDLHAEDEINERNCLHEAAISGRGEILDLALAGGVDGARMDVYGRLPLHYVSMHGQVLMIRNLLQSKPGTIDSIDHDNFTPLIHGIVHHKFECVQELLAHGARIEPDKDADHIPLNLACQHGSTQVIELLLRKGAKIISDAEGLYPQHLVARNGLCPPTLLLLQHYGADLDQRDKLYSWTPLFHAISEGKVECVNSLLQRGVRVDILDEKELSPMYYAVWEGHLECMKLIAVSSMRQADLDQAQGTNDILAIAEAAEPMKIDSDGIPDLSLPPPIIPLRRYGHNFLDKKAFVQLSFETLGSNAITFYNDSKFPAARLTISSKSSDLIPRNIMLPIQEDSRHVSFQVDNLDVFAVEFDVYPTFGSKIIARTVALPNTFAAATSSSGQCCLPLFDPRLRPIGHINFRFQVIKPFQGIPLEIAQFETYWKATSHLDIYPSSVITGSSLSGEYVQLFLQLTSDCIPILYPRWCINHHGIEIPIGRLSLSQILFSTRGKENQMLASVASDPSELAELYQMLASCPLVLRDVLNALPPSIHVDIHVLYPNAAEEQRLGVEPKLNINNYADAILTDIFDHARILREQRPDLMRSIIFTSYNADICTALNWKQPNFPVLLCNDIGSHREVSSSRLTSPVACDGHYSMSVKEAVRIAQSNNFMGLLCTLHILNLAPSLIESIKVAGLVLVADASTSSASVQESLSQGRVSAAGKNTFPGERGAAGRRTNVADGVNGVLNGQGILKFYDTIDM